MLLEKYLKLEIVFNEEARRKFIEENKEDISAVEDQISKELTRSPIFSTLKEKVGFINILSQDQKL